MYDYKQHSDRRGRLAFGKINFPRRGVGEVLLTSFIHQDIDERNQSPKSASSAALHDSED